MPVCVLIMNPSTLVVMAGGGRSLPAQNVAAHQVSESSSGLKLLMTVPFDGEHVVHGLIDLESLLWRGTRCILHVCLLCCYLSRALFKELV